MQTPANSKAFFTSMLIELFYIKNIVSSPSLSRYTTFFLRDHVPPSDNPSNQAKEEKKILSEVLEINPFDFPVRFFYSPLFLRLFVAISQHILITFTICACSMLVSDALSPSLD